MMTDSFLFEINRGYKTQPGSSNKEYVQWQRGPLSKTSLQEMKSYVDTTLAHNNIWLVLVFHGIDGLGWEALPHELLETYFRYIKQKENSLWVATFADVAKYMRERMHADINENKTSSTITVHLKQTLDGRVYDAPLTLKTYVPASWSIVKSNQQQNLKIQKDAKGSYVLYNAMPGQTIRLSYH